MAHHQPSRMASTRHLRVLPSTYRPTPFDIFRVSFLHKYATASSSTMQPATLEAKLRVRWDNIDEVQREEWIELQGVAERLGPAWEVKYVAALKRKQPLQAPLGPRQRRLTKERRTAPSISLRPPQRIQLLENSCEVSAQICILLFADWDYPQTHHNSWTKIVGQRFLKITCT